MNLQCGGAVFVVLVCIVIGAVVYALIYAPRKHKQPKLSVEAVDYMRRNKERTEQEMRERGIYKGRSISSGGPRV